tara:strand:+ start:29104 stop:29841 length:738 start_codon:yes stop_codon:yes gene_type:complete
MKVLVVGESCRDVFNYGVCERLCPEAPVPVFNPINVVENDGMAMNVKNNINSIGAIKAEIFTNPNWRSVRKTRFIDHRTNHMFMRLDENDNKIKRCKLSKINFKNYDAVVISDYNKGYVTEEDIKYISSENDLVFLDTKKMLDPAWCSDISYIKINSLEYNKTEHLLNDDIKKKFIITYGQDGAKHNGILYPVPRVEIKDVSGAGDTFLAGLVTKFMQTKDISESIRFANECATRVVQSRGVSVV